MPSIRAKFVVNEVKNYVGQEIVSASAVVGSDGDNAQWSKYTPNGSLSLTITNQQASGLFPPGTEIYLDISTAG